MIEFMLIMLIICGILFIMAIAFVFVVMAIEGTNTAAAIDEWVAERMRKKIKRKGGDSDAD